MTTHTLNGYQVRYPLQPGEVPVFEAADMCEGMSHDGERHCASGWRAVLGLDLSEFVRAYRIANNLDAEAAHSFAWWRA